jgi:hypothetical protein
VRLRRILLVNVDKAFPYQDDMHESDDSKQLLVTPGRGEECGRWVC